MKCPRCLGEVQSLHSYWRGYDITPNPLCPKCCNDMVLEQEKLNKVNPKYLGL